MIYDWLTIKPHFRQLIFDAAKPVKGFRGRRGRRCKFSPAAETEKELHIEPKVPTDENEEDSKASNEEAERGSYIIPRPTQ